VLNTGGTIKADAGADLSIYNGTFAGGIMTADPGFASFSLRGDYTVAENTASTFNVPGPTAVGLNNAVGFTFAGPNSSIDISSNLTGATSLAASGPGTMVLTGDNSGVTGGMSVNDGATVVVNSSNALGGAGAVTLNSGTIRTTAAITDAHEIRVTGGGTIDTNGFDSTFTGTTSQNGGLTKAGAGTLFLDGPTTHTGATAVTGGSLVLGQSLTTSASVTTDNDGVLVLASDGTAKKVINTGALTINGASKVDVSDNKLLTTTPVGSFTGGAYNGVQGDVARAYNFGSWDQPGLMTSQENAGPNAGPLSGTTTVGVATGEQILFIAPTDTGVFAGQTVTGATTLVMYTYAGDMNFDGLVDAADYGVIDNWVQFPGTDGYANGDLNYDGVIDAADYGIIDNTIQLQGAPFPGVNDTWASGAGASASAGLSGVTAVPEPASLSIVGLAAAALMRRRRRPRQQ
jgi:autotransporter-associated beta strand protein